MCVCACVGGIDDTKMRLSDVISCTADVKGTSAYSAGAIGKFLLFRANAVGSHAPMNVYVPAGADDLAIFDRILQLLTFPT